MRTTKIYNAPYYFCLFACLPDSMPNIYNVVVIYTVNMKICHNFLINISTDRLQDATASKPERPKWPAIFYTSYDAANLPGGFFSSLLFPTLTISNGNS